jgi:hypothetical protein
MKIGWGGIAPPSTLALSPQSSLFPETAAPNMFSPYKLPEEVHACRIGDTWIFLDVRRDRYLCLVSQQATWFTQLNDAGRLATVSDDALRFAEHLCTRGLLTRSHPPVWRSPEVRPASSTQPGINVRERLRSVSRWTEFAMMTHGMARFGHLQNPKRRNLKKILHTVQGWKSKAAAKEASQTSSALGLSQSFHALSPWFFTSRDACFFRSLMLVYFLARHNVLSDWSFAVRLSPFRAHCWVSAQGVLLNEDPDVAAGFTPVLSI